MEQSPDLLKFQFTLIPAHRPEELHTNIRSAVARNLPRVKECSAHGERLSVIGGGPSLHTTCDQIADGSYLAAINGSLGWLLDKGIVPQMCGVCDPSPHMVDIVRADPRVTYFLAAIVHPSLYDKLLAAGCKVFLWHISSVPGGEELLNDIDPDFFMVGGGSTMGLRWITLGYSMGFRKFDLHGMDSSFLKLNDWRRASHAYPDHQDDKDWMEYDGYQTRPNFIGQVADFLGWLERLRSPDVDPVDIRVFGDGLLQSEFHKWKDANPGLHEGKPKPVLMTDKFEWPEWDRFAKSAVLQDSLHIPEFLKQVHDRRLVVQAGGNVGVYPAILAQYFTYVHTFEPAPVNYDRLARNIQGVPGRIQAINAALGAEPGNAFLAEREPHNAGSIFAVYDAGGDVRVLTIDQMDLPFCSLIWLDVEGNEEAVLQGARRTIAQFSPKIIIEVKGDTFPPSLIDNGYKPVMRLGNDVLFDPPVKAMTIRKPSVKPVERVTIACVMTGNYLGRGVDYVARLITSIISNLPKGPMIRFIVYTDDVSQFSDEVLGLDGVGILPLPSGLYAMSGWWNKLFLFHPAAFEPGERVVYFDLDTLITGSLDDILQYNGQFAILRDAYRPDGWQSSVMAWEAGTMDHVWHHWEAAGRPQLPGGDQQWIEQIVAKPDVDIWQDILPGQFRSYKVECRPYNRLPADTRVVFFHGSPRPHEAAMSIDWVNHYWNGGK